MIDRVVMKRCWDWRKDAFEIHAKTLTWHNAKFRSPRCADRNGTANADVFAGFRQLELGAYEQVVPRRDSEPGESADSAGRGRASKDTAAERFRTCGFDPRDAEPAARIRLRASIAKVFDDAPACRRHCRIEAYAAVEVALGFLGFDQPFDAPAVRRSKSDASADRHSQADVSLVVPELYDAGRREDFEGLSGREDGRKGECDG